VDTDDAPKPERPRRWRIDLALQGGGAHGAFTWGVLDRLLEDRRIGFEAISGASAGAMNAVVLAHGLASGGRAGARDALRGFWHRVARASAASAPVAALFSDWVPRGSPLGWSMEWIARTFGPAQLNPLDINPLRDILAATVDFERLRATPSPRLYVSATHVPTGRLREFRRHEIGLDAVMASACLPTVFRAVTVDGEPYWDGGYVGNPSLMPLIVESPAHDLLLVQINPTRRDAVPTTAAAIAERVNEITFNASLVKELRTIALIRSLLDAEGPPPDGPRSRLFEQIGALRLHRIDGGDALSGFGADSKLHAAWPFVQRLHRLGSAAADDWLRRSGAHLGRRSTMDLAAYR
jgi:NTE family protein